MPAMWDDFTEIDLQNAIQKNLTAATKTLNDLTFSVLDGDLEESMKMVLWLSSQTRGIEQMLLQASKQRFNISR